MATNQSSLSLGSSSLVSGLGKPDISDTDGNFFSDNSGGNLYKKNTNIPGQWESVLKTNRINLSLINNTTPMLTGTNSWTGIPGDCLVSPLSSSSFTYSSSQLILDPNGDGGFESSAIQGTQGFAANNWTVINGGTFGGGGTLQTNRWYVGVTGASPSGRGQYGAYISNNNGASNSYSDITSIVWFYRDLNFPPFTTSISLSFLIRVLGEATFDYTRVYQFPTSQTLTAGLNISTVNAGFLTEVGSGESVDSFETISLSFNLPTLSSSTQSRRVAFNWVNDASTPGGPGNPPSSIDKISVTANLPIRATYTGSQSRFKSVLSGSFQSTVSLSSVSVKIVKNKNTTETGTEASFNISANFKDTFVVQDTFTLSNGDYIEPYLNNRVSNSSITVNDLQLSIWEVPY